MSQGRIPKSDVEYIREHTPIEEVVGDYVQLKPSGSSMKGLSPFKDEKTPSFFVHPHANFFKCFSTGIGGDVFTFLMELEHLSFPEAVEYCADYIGYSITYEGPNGRGQRNQPDQGSRQRLLLANKRAAEFYVQQLQGSAEGADVARAFLRDRGFEQEIIEKFGCGYAPGGWDTLTKHLQREGFSFKELEEAGLARMGKMGPIDRFHRRLLWPIRTVTGDVIGFGARKLFDDDQLGKYLNTPETRLYKKSSVLFGIDLAKKAIAADHTAVVVEGYTDVMAMHAAGHPGAVASCGTAFGSDHLQILRRFMMDDSFFRGRIIYTFDGDDAGERAATRAFAGDQAFSGHSLVAVAPDGMDPCDLRLARGDAAISDMIEQAVPMFEFVITTVLEAYDTTRIEERVQAMQRIVPLLGAIRDNAMREQYARTAAGWLAWDDPDEILQKVREAAASRPAVAPAKVVRGAAGKNATRNGAPAAARGGAPAAAPTAAPSATEEEAALREADSLERPDPGQRSLEGEREVLKTVMQRPELSGAMFDLLPPSIFRHPTYIAIASAIAAAGGAESATAGPNWVVAVSEAVGDRVGSIVVAELAVEPLKCQPGAEEFYCWTLMHGLQERLIAETIATLKAQLQRMTTGIEDPEYQRIYREIWQLEEYRRAAADWVRGVGKRTPPAS